MSQNSQNGKSPLRLRAENDALTSSSTISASDQSTAGEPSFAAKLASSASSLARDVFTRPASDVTGSLAGLTNGKAVAGPSSLSSSSRAGDGEAGVAQGVVDRGTTSPMMAEAPRFRTSRHEDGDMEAAFDSFTASDGYDRNGGPQHTAMSTEQLRAEMQDLHDSWHREWARHPGDIEAGGSSGARSVVDGGGVGEGDVHMAKARDGSDVVALLSADEDDIMQHHKPFYADGDLQVEIEDAKDVDASDLFPGFPPTTQSQPGNKNDITEPDVLHNPTYNFLPLANIQDSPDQELWLLDWERVLTSYADDVWDPSSFPWVLEAREAIQEVKENSSKSGAKMSEDRERALERLSMVVGHIKVPDAAAKQGRGEKEEGAAAG